MKNKILIFYSIIINTFLSSTFAQNALPVDKLETSEKKIKYYHVEEVINLKFGGSKKIYNVTYENLISTCELGPNGKRTITPVFEEERKQLITKTNKNEKRIIYPVLKEQEEQPRQPEKINKKEKRTFEPVLEEEQEEQERQLAQTLKNGQKFITSLSKVIKAKEEERKSFGIIKKSEILRKGKPNTLTQKVQQNRLSNTLTDLNTINDSDKISTTGTIKEESNATYAINVIEIYENVVNDGYESIEILTTIADSYYFKNDLKNAHKYYEKLFKNSVNDLEVEYYYRYSIALRSENKIKTADLYLKKYNELKNKNPKRNS